MALRLSGLQFPRMPSAASLPMALRLSGLRFPHFPCATSLPDGAALIGPTISRLPSAASLPDGAALIGPTISPLSLCGEPARWRFAYRSCDFPAFPLRRACPMALRLSGLLSPYADPIRVGRIRRSRHPAMPTQCPFTDNGQLPINLKESPIPLAEHQISVAAF